MALDAHWLSVYALILSLVTHRFAVKCYRIYAHAGRIGGSWRSRIRNRIGGAGAPCAAEGALASDIKCEKICMRSLAEIDST